MDTAGVFEQPLLSQQVHRSQHSFESLNEGNKVVINTSETFQIKDGTAALGDNYFTSHFTQL